MFVFGGGINSIKPLEESAPRETTETTELTRIQTLELQEKQLLAELDRTRRSLEEEVKAARGKDLASAALVHALAPSRESPSRKIRDAIVANRGKRTLPLLTSSSELAFEVGLNGSGKKHLLPVFQMPVVEAPVEIVHAMPRETADGEDQRMEEEAGDRERLRSMLGLTKEEADLFDGICPPPPKFQPRVAELLPELKVPRVQTNSLPSLEEKARTLRLEETYGGGKRKSFLYGAKRKVDANEALRARLNRSMKAVQQYTEKVQQDLAEIKQFCPVTDIRAQRYIRKWGMVKLETAINKYRQHKLRSCLHLWRKHIDAIVLQEKRNAYLMLKAANKLKHLFVRFNHGRHRRSFYKWKDWVVAVVKQEQAEALTSGAIAVQRCVRRRHATRHVRHMIEAKAAEAKNAAALRIQALLRARTDRKKVVFLREKRALHVACVTIQRNFRKCRADKLRHHRTRAALMVQCAWRRKNGRLALHLLKQGKREVAAVKLQAQARRRRALRKREEAIRHRACLKMQRVYRGRRGRLAMQARREERMLQCIREEQVALKLQAVFRGHRGRLLYQLKFQLKNAKSKEHDRKITKLQALFRGRQGRKEARQVKDAATAELREWAKEWQEYYDEQSGTYAFHNLFTQEIVYDPPLQGFIKADGMLALSDGRIVADGSMEGQGNGDGEFNLRKCVECEFNAATRLCDDCGDEYCDECYGVVHEKGKFKAHVFQWVQNGGVQEEVPVEEVHEWDEYFDEDSGYPYWYNIQTGDTVWENPYETSIDHPGDYVGQQAVEEQPEWEEYFDESTGLAYWYNTITQETSWDPPGEEVVAAEDVTWEEHLDEETGTPYWYNTLTGESSWESPYTG